MNTHGKYGAVIILIGHLALTSWPVTAESNKSVTRYSVVGELSAKNVCQSVINDNAHSLRVALHKHQRNKSRIQRFYNVSGYLSMDDFSCDGESIADFAIQLGSADVMRYLEDKTPIRGTVSMKELSVASQ